MLGFFHAFCIIFSKFTGRPKKIVLCQRQCFMEFKFLRAHHLTTLYQGFQGITLALHLLTVVDLSCSCCFDLQYVCVEVCCLL